MLDKLVSPDATWEELYNVRNVLMDLISRDEEINCWKHFAGVIADRIPSILGALATASPGGHKAIVDVIS